MSRGSRMLRWRFAAAVLAVAGTLTGGLAAAAVANASLEGPGPPPPSRPGFTSVITSVTIGPAGGIVGPVACNGGSQLLTIPPGAFPTSVQITLTCGNLALLGPFAFPGFSLVNAVGVTVQLHGSTYPGTFLRPLTLTARQATITAASVVGIWNGASFTLDTDSTVAPGVLTVSFDTDPDFGFMTPTSTPRGAGDRLVLLSRSLRVHNGRVSVPFKCRSARPCVGGFSISVHARSRTTGAVVTIACTQSRRSFFRLRPEATAVLRVPLQTGCLAELQHAQPRATFAKLTSGPRSGQAGVIRTVRLTLR